MRSELPPQPLEMKPGDSAFVVVPIGRSWERVHWRAVQVTAVSASGTATVRTEEGRLFYAVPAALMLPASTERLLVGQVVRVGVGRDMPYGRISRLEGGRVVVDTVYLGALREVDAAPSEVLVVPHGPRAAVPVVYRLGEVQRIGSLVAVGGKMRWVLGAEGVIHRLPWTEVTELDLSLLRRPGETLRAALHMDLREVTVVAPLDGGLRYEVGWGESERQVVCFSALAPP